MISLKDYDPSWFEIIGLVFILLHFMAIFGLICTRESVKSLRTGRNSKGLITSCIANICVMLWIFSGMDFNFNTLVNADTVLVVEFLFALSSVLFAVFVFIKND